MPSPSDDCMATTLTEEKLGGLKESEDTKPVPVNKVRRPTLPPSFFKFPFRSRLKIIQQYISSFEYKQSPRTSFNSLKSRPLARIMDTAKMAGIPEAERIPLSFKSQLHGQVYQHIVLLVKFNNKYGAFGISRQHNLMSKEFEFESVSSIVNEYRKAYEEYEHKVTRIRIGLPVEHNIESFNFVCWRQLSLDPSLVSWEKCLAALERHMNHAKRLWERWLLDGQRENKTADLLLTSLDTKPNHKFHKSSLRRQKISTSSSDNSIVPRQEPDKPDPDSELKSRRHALHEMPSMLNIRSQPFSWKLATKFSSRVQAGPPLFQRSSKSTCSFCPTLTSDALIAGPVSLTKQQNIKKTALKCYLVEPFSGFRGRLGLQTNNRKPKMKQDKQDMKRPKQSVAKPKLPNLSTKSYRKSSKERSVRQFQTIFKSS